MGPQDHDENAGLLSDFGKTSSLLHDVSPRQIWILTNSVHSFLQEAATADGLVRKVTFFASYFQLFAVSKKSSFTLRTFDLFHLDSSLVRFRFLNLNNEFSTHCTLITETQIECWDFLKALLSFKQSTLQHWLTMQAQFKTLLLSCPTWELFVNKQTVEKWISCQKTWFFQRITFFLVVSSQQWTPCDVC